MKKVFLVYASLSYFNGGHCDFLINVFASAKKANVYVDYRRLSIERRGAAYVFGTGVEYASIRLDIKNICLIDWSDDLKSMLSVEKRNFELTKKYNLLEFV